MQGSPRIAVIGGGIAGLTAAHRLVENFDVLMVEANPERLGGRMFTQHNVLDTDRIWERGGELLATDNPILFQLCHDFGLHVYEVPGERGEFAFRIDGHTYRASEVFNHETGEGPYKLLAALITLHKTLALDADGHWRSLAQNFDVMSLNEYLHQCAAFANTPEWLVRLIETAYFAENGLPCDEQSALNLIWMLDTALKQSWQPYGSVDDARYRIEGGFEALVKALADDISQHAPIYLGTRLVAIKQEEGQTLTLTFESEHGRFQEHVDHVILAVPHNVLQHIEGLDQLPMHQKAREGIAQITGATHTKMALQTRAPWATLFPDGTLNGNLVMNIGDSALNAWVSSNGEGESVLSVLIAGSLAHQPPEVIAEICRREIAAAFNLSADEMFTDNYLVQSWANEPHIGTSYSCAKPHQLEMREALSEPQAFGRVLFASEAIDPIFLAFAEGAARSGELAAENILAQYRLLVPPRQVISQAH